MLAATLGFKLTVHRAASALQMCNTMHFHMSSALSTLDAQLAQQEGPQTEPAGQT